MWLVRLKPRPRDRKETHSKGSPRFHRLTACQDGGLGTSQLPILSMCLSEAADGTGMAVLVLVLVPGPRPTILSFLTRAGSQHLEPCPSAAFLIHLLHLRLERRAEKTPPVVAATFPRAGFESIMWTLEILAKLLRSDRNGRGVKEGKFPIMQKDANGKKDGFPIPTATLRS